MEGLIEKSFEFCFCCLIVRVTEYLHAGVRGKNVGLVCALKGDKSVQCCLSKSSIRQGYKACQILKSKYTVSS